MEDISLHILDIAENSIEAGATMIKIEINISKNDDRLILSISDNGRGMDEETINMVKDPFFSTKTVRTKRFGLGIPLLAQSAEQCNGKFSIKSELGRGTIITAEFQLSHIDMKPLGDIGSTMMILIGGHPDRDFSLSYSENGFSYKIETTEIKRELGEVPINQPDVLKLIKEDINIAIKNRSLK